MNPKCLKMSDEPASPCQYCGAGCVKAGRSPNGSQKLRCRACRKYQLDNYRNQGCRKSVKENILKIYLKNVGIRDVAELLKVSVNTVLKEVGQYKSFRPVTAYKQNREYEIDELSTYVGNKKYRRWLVYAIDRQSREVVSIAVGRRTLSTINRVVGSVLHLNPTRIYTDGLNLYQSLISKNLHKVKAHGIQIIERSNLTMRGRLRRLNRKTLAYSKSESMLLASARLLFWKRFTNNAIGY